MKKLISALLVAMCLVIVPAQAQLKFGVKGGVNLSKADFNSSDLKTDNFTGFFIGPMAELTIPVIGLGVDGSLLFSQKGLKGNGESIKQNSIEIPVNLKYSIGLGSLASVFAAAGPCYSFGLNDKTIDGATFKQKAALSLNLGFGLKLLRHLQLGANYNIPMSNTTKVTWKNTEESFSAKNKTWQISAAYIF